MTTTQASRRVLVVLDQNIGNIGKKVRRRGEQRRIDQEIANVVERPDVTAITSIRELGFGYDRDTEPAQVLARLRERGERDGVIVLFLSRSGKYFSNHVNGCACLYVPNLAVFMGQTYHPAHRLARFSKLSMLRFIACHMSALLQDAQAHFDSSNGNHASAA